MIRLLVASLGLSLVLSSPTAKAQVTLQQKVAEGTTYRAKTTSKTQQTLKIAGNDVETKAENEGVGLATAGKRGADGTLPIEITVESVKVSMSLPGGIEVALDTAEPDRKVEIPQLAFVGEIFKVIKGSGYTIVLDSKDAVKFVEGTEKNLAKAGDLSPEATKALKSRFNADKIKQEYEEEHALLPDTPVREGEPWERTSNSDIGGGQTLTFKNRLEYKGTVKKGEKTLDKIEVKALEVTYKMDPDPDAQATVTASALKVDSSEGTILFDREAGAVVARSGKTRITGDMTLKIGEMELPTKLDLTIETSTTVEKVDKK